MLQQCAGMVRENYGSLLMPEYIHKCLYMVWLIKHLQENITDFHTTYKASGRLVEQI